ncbi:MAG: triose-phosphate isomerase [Phycisphaerales bacterium]|jgi:triosephosphate isomerase (TIM)|nr:triose-phosphate isomerase [Phycisphaerales bacterium]
MARKIFIAGNWKMNTTLESGAALVAGLKETLAGIDTVEFGAFVPACYLGATAANAAGSNFQVGAQNMYFEPKGAFTAEISGDMIKDCGATMVLLGHSERRHIFGETDELINTKVQKALADGLQVILAIGELLEERKAGETNAVNERQLRKGLAGVTAEQMATITIAYEPVWAIGTGEVATPDQAQEAHAYVRSILADMFGAEVADATRIQYGGSMNPGNVENLLAQPDVDGGLIGGASLKVEDFTALITAGVAEAAK